jgi:hypothetical protein
MDTTLTDTNISSNSNEIIHDDKKNEKFGLLKINLFVKEYIKLFKLVLKSIIPDLKSFKWWQALILIIFATFMVVFSVLVTFCFVI